MRVHLDLKYSGIIEETKQSIADLVPGNKVHCQLQRSPNTESDEETSVVVSAYWKAWPCWFPQHGPGKKHNRPIHLEQRQTTLVEAAPGLLVRGLIHSDGCRFVNTGTNWSCPRYSFSNRSDDIRSIFEWACGLLGLRTMRAPHTVYVSRKKEVSELDRHVGPKY